MDFKNSIFVYCNSDNIRLLTEPLIAADRRDALKNTGNAIKRGQCYLLDAFGNLLTSCVILCCGDEIIFEIEGNDVYKLSDIRKGYEGIAETTLTIGVGKTLSDSRRALVYAKLHGGNKICFWTDKIGKDLKELANKASEVINKADNNDLIKMPYILPAHDSKYIGENKPYGKMPHESHIHTNRTENELYHHVMSKQEPGGITKFRHILSEHEDPQKEPLAQIRMEKPANDHPQVTSSKVGLKQAGKGHGKLLYMEAVKHHGKIYSDDKVSKKAQKVYQHMAGLADFKVKLGKPNTSERHSVEWIHKREK